MRWLNTKQRQSIPWATFASEPFCCVPVGVKEKAGFYPTEKKKKDVLFLSFKSSFVGENFLIFSVMGSLRITFFF